METTMSKKEKIMPKKRILPKYKLKKEYRTFAVVIAVIMVLSLISTFLSDINHAYTNVSINFASVNGGKNPDGSMFDVYEIKSDAVLIRACEKLDNKITPEELKSHLSISSNTTEADLNKINESILNGQTTYMHNASFYTVSYNVVSDEIKADGLDTVIGAAFKNLIYPSKTKILNAVVESYREYYENAYIISDDVLQTDWTELENSDYYNQNVKIKSVLLRMNRYFGTCYDADAEFVSKKYGVGFGDLQKQTTDLLNLDWENYNSYIIKNGITENKDSLLKQFSFMKKNYELMNKRDLSEYDAIKTGIEKYDPSVTKVVFIPALDTSDLFYMNRTRIGIDYMVETANTVKLSADTNKNDAEHCEYLIGEFSNKDTVTREQIDVAKQMRNDIISKIDAIAETALNVNNEYRLSEAYMEIGCDDATGFEGIMFWAVKFVKSFLGLSIFAIFIYLIFEFIKKHKLGSKFFEEV